MDTMLLAEIGFSVFGLMSLYCDYKEKFSIVHNPVLHNQTKHVEVNHHFIKDHLKFGTICMLFAKIKDQLADVVTKRLHSIVHFYCWQTGNVGPPFSSLRGNIGIQIYMRSWYYCNTSYMYVEVGLVLLYSTIPQCMFFTYIYITVASSHLSLSSMWTVYLIFCSLNFPKIPISLSLGLSPSPFN